MPCANSGVCTCTCSPTPLFQKKNRRLLTRTHTPSDHLCLPACLLCPPAGLALFPQALALVNSSGGISAARHLAESEAALARGALAVLPDGPAKTSLNLMVDYVLERIH